ncbi:hypothetical protein HN51_003747, partial [Arachis hypogaea]
MNFASWLIVVAPQVLFVHPGLNAPLQPTQPFASLGHDLESQSYQRFSPARSMARLKLFDGVPMA